MYRICLINMPFAALYIPSIALAQLQAILEERFGAEVTVETYYLNHDFGEWLDPYVYSFISESMAGHVSGFGEWFFAATAFPESRDTEADFFERYSVHLGKQNLAVWESQLRPKHRRLAQYLDELIERYRLDEADLVGFTSMFFQNLASFALARRVKMKRPEIVIAMGGANCESPMGEEIARHVPWVDYVFSGPALVSFPGVVEKLMEGDRPAAGQFDGVFTRNKLEKPAGLHVLGDDCHGSGNIGRELDINYPLSLDYDGFLHSFTTHFPGVEQKPHLLFETSRGCWWGEKAHCTFCGLNGGTMAYRAMRPERAIAQFQELLSKYADRVDHFACVDNILPKNYCREVFAQLDVPENVSFFYEVKADVTDEELRVLADAHVRELQPGIESLSSITLKLMKKGTTSFTNVSFLRAALQHGIKPTWNLLVGFPGEPGEVYEKYLRDLRHLVHLPPPLGAYPVRFDRFSPYFVRAAEYKLDLRPLDYYEMIYPFPPETVYNLAYYFADQNYDAPYVTTLQRYLRPVQDLIAGWRALWTEGDRRTPPVLCWDSVRGALLDSRGTATIRHHLPPDARGVLEQLGRPKPIELLVRENPGRSATIVEASLTELVERGLVFTENGKYLSLVMPPQTGSEEISLAS